MKKLKIGKKSGLRYFDMADIRSLGPCYDPNRYLAEDFRGTAIDILDHANIPFPDKLWVILRSEIVSEKCMRLFAVWSARQSLVNNSDERLVKALEVMERFANGQATEEERSAAWSAASAARSAAEAAAEAAASAAEAAAWSAASAAEAAAWSAAWSAAEAAASAARSAASAARSAAWSAAWSAASAAEAAAWSAASAAWSAARSAAWSAQQVKFREMIIADGLERRAKLKK